MLGDKPKLNISGKEYRYRLISTGESSQKYGKCEICGEHASEVFHQIEEKKYPQGWTHAECHDAFGHEKCLKNIRR